MKSCSAFKAVCSVLFGVLLFAVPVFADHVPTFSDPEVNAYVQSWSEFVRDYDAATASFKTTDRSKVLTFLSRAQVLQAQASQVVLKVKLDERQRFMQYMMQCSKNISDLSDRFKRSISEANRAPHD